MDKSLEINIDLELEQARKNAYEATNSATKYSLSARASTAVSYMAYETAGWSARNSAWAASYSAVNSAKSVLRSAVNSAYWAKYSACSLVNVSSSCNEERLKQLEMIKAVL